MRLLYFGDDRKVSLTKDLLGNDKIPPYAILSHTWDDEEVTFEDLTNGTGEGKKGHEKIGFCMQQAAADGLQYSWVDTCCINKSDFTELQHAINSFFRWYRDAANCYVFLSDVSATKRKADSDASQFTWEPAFRKSRWFTRGWTLQELLAPRKLSFFSKEGSLLGDAQKLRRLVHSITQLPIAVLTGASLEEISTDERLRWTEHRTTTRDEDKAYSLLGILGVFMPLIYGEGQANAFRRLRGEIKNRVYPSSASIKFTEQNFGKLTISLSFQDQDNRYTDIHVATETCKWLAQDTQYTAWTSSTQGLFWIKGNPGTGKSVLMKHAVRDIAKQNPDQLVVSFFVHGRGLDLQKTPLGMFRALLNSLLGHFPDCLDKLTALFEDRERRFGGYQAKRWSWKHQELQQLFSELLVKNTRSRQVTIFVDALDELGEEHARALLAYFRDISVQAIDNEANFKLCFSSRHYPILGLEAFPTISVEERNSVDIQWYVNDRLARVSLCTRRRQIQEEIMAKAKGGFQWVFLVTQTLIDRNLTGRSLAGHVTSCPLTLSETYASLLSSGPRSDEKQMLRLLQWILFAGRPLSSQELREALATDAHTDCTTIAALRSNADWSEGLLDFERYVKHVSKGLVEFRTRDFWESWEKSDREAQFIHQSVADYLLEDYAKTHEEGLVGKGHFQISRSCLKYLTMGDVLSGSGLPRDKLSSSFPLAPYAVRYLFAHIRKAEEAGLDQRDLLLALQWPSPLETSRRLGDIWRTLNFTNAGTPLGWPFPVSPGLHVLAALGSPSAMKAALKEDAKVVNDVDSDGNTPLHIAIATGHQDVALELLRQHRECQNRSRNSNLRRPSLPEPSSAPSAFLNLNTKNKEDETPLDAAVAMECHTIVDDMIDLGADLKILSQPYLLVCHAIDKRDMALLAKLIAGGINLMGALYFAVENGSSKDIVQALAEGGGDVNRQVTSEADDFDEDNETAYDEWEFRQWGGNALHLACHRGLDAEVNILLANGASAIACDDEGQCPLHIAIAMREDGEGRHCSLETIACLLEYEPTAVEIEDDYGMSPLMVLAGYHSDRLDAPKDLKILVKLFLRKAQFSVPSATLTEFFLEHHELWSNVGMETLDTVRVSSIVGSMDLAARNEENQSVLWLAAAGGLSVLLDGLLARGSSDVNESDACSTSPLLAAVEGHHVNVVRSLLAADKINVNAQDHSGFSPLYAAVGHETSNFQDYEDDHEILALLLAAPGIDIDLGDRDWPLLLDFAAMNGCGTCIARLLDSAGNTSDASNMLVTKALFAAIRAENMEAVNLLLFHKDIVITTTLSEGQSLLHAAIQTRDCELVSKTLDITTSVLIPEGHNRMLFDVNAKTVQGASPLLEAVHLGSRTIVSILITVEGLDVNAQDKEGLSPLLAAVKKKDADIVEILLTNNNIDVNIKDQSGMSPLLYASRAVLCSENSTIIDRLLAVEDVEISDASLAALLLYDERRRMSTGGDSMLCTAIQMDSTHLVHLLVDKGGLDVNVLRRKGYSALRLAAERPDKTIFKYLVARHQTNLDIEDTYGRSLLSWAAEVGIVTVVMVLLSTGRVNLYHSDHSGLTPLQKAQRNGHRVIATMLHAHLDAMNLRTQNSAQQQYVMR